MGSSKHDEGSYPELFPEDYGQRLERLLELADISWEQFADFLGVEYDLVMEWREGAIPSGGQVWQIMHLAWNVPGGMEVMLPETAGDGEQTT